MCIAGIYHTAQWSRTDACGPPRRRSGPAAILDQTGRPGPGRKPGPGRAAPGIPPPKASALSLSRDTELYPAYIASCFINTLVDLTNWLGKPQVFSSPSTSALFATFRSPLPPPHGLLLPTHPMQPYQSPVYFRASPKSETRTESEGPVSRIFRELPPARPRPPPPVRRPPPAVQLRITSTNEPYCARRRQSWATVRGCRLSAGLQTLNAVQVHSHPSNGAMVIARRPASLLVT